jgi:hypothetical protein
MMYIKYDVLVHNTPAHLDTKWCKRGTVRKRKRELECEYLCGMEVQISVLGTVIESVDCFWYLGRPITDTGTDCIAVVYNLIKARGRWAQVSKILSHQHSQGSLDILQRNLSICFSIWL